VSVVRFRLVLMSTASDSGSGDRLITADEVAAILNVSKAWVYEQTRRQRMPHVRLGRFVRYRRSTLYAWLEQQESGNYR
jgi:excisionase family DNA binding protein